MKFTTKKLMLLRHCPNKMTLFFQAMALAILLTSLSACSTSRTAPQEMSVDSNIRISELKREDYEVLPEVKGTSKSTKVFFLFIPFSGKSKEKMKRQAYNRAVAQASECDGIIRPRYEEKKIVIPLIIFNIVIRQTHAYGKGFRIKTD